LASLDNPKAGGGLPPLPRLRDMFRREEGSRRKRLVSFKRVLASCKTWDW